MIGGKMPKPRKQSARINRAIAKLRDEGIKVEPFETGKVILGEELKYVLTHAELLDLMDKDQVTWHGVKELHRRLKKHFTPPPASSP